MEKHTSPVKDVVHHIEVSDVDCLYRISRCTGNITRVVYVTVCDASIIPEFDRTYPPAILRNLRRLEDWDDQEWHTLHVVKTETGVGTIKDLDKLDMLPEEDLLVQLPRYDIFDVEVPFRPKQRTSRALLDGKKAFMKIAPYPYEMRYVLRELLMYQHMMMANVQGGPKLLGYVYEETPDRVIGFLCEAISGRHPSIADYELCKDALERLHEKGIYHGDLNKYNIMITPADEVFFLDFAISKAASECTDGEEEIATLMQKETESLQSLLLNLGDEGKSFPHENE